MNMNGTDESTCLHRSVQGRVLYCSEFGRMVLDFKGCYFVFRPCEFQRFLHHFSNMVTCPWSHARLKEGEEIHVRDAAGRNVLVLHLSDLQELVDLMTGATSHLESRGQVMEYGFAHASFQA